jgi:hypothetical protein
MTFKLVEDPNNIKVELSLSRMPQAVKKSIRRGSYITGKQLVADVRDKMTRGVKSGRTYKISRGRGGRLLSRPRLHRASAAGEYPAPISGNLRKTVDFKVRGADRLEFGAGDNSVKYAKVLELGGSKVKARKYLRQTIDRLQNQTKTNLSKEINKGLKSLGLKVNKF